MGNDVTLRHRHHHGSHCQQNLFIGCYQGRGHSVRDGAPPLPMANPQGHLAPYMGEGQRISKKMGGIILVASVIVWALEYFPHNEELTLQQQQEQSYIGRMGKAIEPVFSPQGFNWKLDVSLLAGVGAKEIVASTIGVLYSGGDEFSEDERFSDNAEKYTHLRQLMITEGITPLAAYAYLIFILLYFPCIATIAAIKNETGSWRWAVFAACYTTIGAWTVSAVVYQIGSLLI